MIKQKAVNEMPKTNSIIRRLFALLLTGTLLLCAAGCEKAPVTNKATRLNYQNFSDYDYLKTLDGTTVSVVGYMTTQMPEDGSFVYLTGLPWQDGPFFAPNSTRLANTVVIYANHGTHFTHMTEAVKMVGILEVAENPDAPFTDAFGNKAYCRITDANYVKVDSGSLTGDRAVWQKLKEEDLINEIYRMLDYVNFLCIWPTCYVNPTADREGYYLTPRDAAYLIATPGAAYNYGNQSGYFDGLAQKLEDIDPELLAEPIACIREAKELAIKALTELKAGNYTSEETYLERFDAQGVVYTLNKGGELTAEKDALNTRFADWLATWTTP